MPCGASPPSRAATPSGPAASASRSLRLVQHQPAGQRVGRHRARGRAGREADGRRLVAGRAEPRNGVVDGAVQVREQVGVEAVGVEGALRHRALAGRVGPLADGGAQRVDRAVVRGHERLRLRDHGIGVDGGGIGRDRHGRAGGDPAQVERDAGDGVGDAVRRARAGDAVDGQLRVLAGERDRDAEVGRQRAVGRQRDGVRRAGVARRQPQPPVDHRRGDAAADGVDLRRDRRRPSRRRRSPRRRSSRRSPGAACRRPRPRRAAVDCVRTSARASAATVTENDALTALPEAVATMRAGSLEVAIGRAEKTPAPRSACSAPRRARQPRAHVGEAGEPRAGEVGRALQPVDRPPLDRHQRGDDGVGVDPGRDAGEAESRHAVTPAGRRSAPRATGALRAGA